MLAHGSFDLTVDNQVLIARISGAWNEEESWLYFERVKEIIQPIMKQPWALLLLMNGWELGTPETEQVTKEMVRWVSSHGLYKVAEVYNPNMLIQLHIERIVKEGPDEIERRHFINEKEAIAWLASNGFPLTNLVYS